MSLLRLSSVTKSYLRGYTAIDVLRDASLTVAAGALVSVYGSRGSGKTTLLKIAAGFEAPDAGEVVLPTRVAWVQSGRPHAGRLAICTHVALPLYRDLGPRAAQGRARRALAAVDAEQYADECWDDIPAVARALCAIVHATIQQPELLVADDPTAGLGAIDRERICRTLRATAEADGLGVLIAVPDIPSMLRSHDTRILSRGRLLAAPDRRDAEIIDIATRRYA